MRKALPTRPSAHALAVLLFVAAVTSAGPATAEPYMAFREGFNCSVCHINRTGGGKRTAFGAMYAQTMLPVWQPRLLPAKAAASDPDASAQDAGPPQQPSGTFVNPQLNSYVGVGANLRFAVTTTFAVDGFEDPARGIKADPVERRVTFGFNEGNLYLDGSLFGQHLVLYLDVEVAPEQAGAREAMLMAKDLFGKAHLYIKGGKLMPPFGIRIFDDNAFTRQVTGFNYATPDLGVEIGLEPGPVFISAALTMGDSSQQYPNRVSGIIAFLGEGGPLRYRLGASGAFLDGRDSEDGKDSNDILMVGGFVALSLGRITAFSEVDYLEGAVRELTLYSEADFLPVRGLNLKIAYELHYPDFDVAIDRNGRERYIFGAELFLVQFAQLRLLYSLNRDIPQIPANNADTLMFEIHGFL